MLSITTGRSARSVRAIISSRQIASEATAAAGTVPDPPLKPARVPAPSGTEAGALTRTCVPTGNCMSQGVAQFVPFTTTIRLASELVTVRCPTGL